MLKNKTKLKIAINGFGRIGRAFLKSLLLEKESGIEVVAINDLTDTKTLAYLLRHDSVYEAYEKDVNFTANALIIGGKKYPILAQKDPSLLPWREMGVDIVIESSGRFRTKDLASLHLKAGAKKVIISAPAKGEKKIKTIVLGVNEDKIKKGDEILSMASCTTNCLAPLSDVIKKNFGISKAIMTTIHSYTADQRLVDGPHKDLRRARAAAINIVPTTTGAAIATTETIPALKDKFDGMSVRVPTPVGSLVDVVFLLNKKTSIKEVNQVIKKATRAKNLKGILISTEEPIVSTDIIGNPASSIVDLSLTKVIDGNLLKVVSWYDNEWGYSNRLVDLLFYLKKKKFV